MPYMMAMGPCFGCRQTFWFNPDRVPSVVIDGDRKPVCRSCIDLANPRRIANGLDPIVPHPDAYAPEEL
jgi:hypothetical protein